MRWALLALLLLVPCAAQAQSEFIKGPCQPNVADVCGPKRLGQQILVYSTATSARDCTAVTSGNLLMLCTWDGAKWIGTPPGSGGAAVLTKTSDYTVTAGEAYGSNFVNTGAVGTVKLTLRTCNSGMGVTLVVMALQSFQIRPSQSGSDQILGPGIASTSAPGRKLSNDGTVLYSAIQLLGVCPSWIVLNTTGGEWTDGAP